MLHNLKFIKDVSWSEIFLVWQKNEGSNPAWQEFARKEKGWNSWEEWRSYQSNLFKVKDRLWQIFEIQNPDDTIANFIMGPFKSWQNHYEKKNSHSFAELVKDKPEWVRNNTGIQKIKSDFPDETQFIGFYLPEKDQVILFEGHHRAAAVALASFESQPIKFLKNPLIALAEMRESDKELFNRLLKIGTNNPKKKQA